MRLGGVFTRRGTGHHAATRSCGPVIVDLVRTALARPAGARLEERVAGVDVARFKHALRYHGVAPFVRQALHDDWDVNLELVEHVRRLAFLANFAHVRATAELALTGPALDDAGVPWLVVKGAVLTAGLYENRRLRTYDDVDLVVARTDLRTAFEALESSGYELANGDSLWPVIRREGAGELSLWRGQMAAPVVDLHWHFVWVESARQAFSIPMDELIARSTPIHVDDLAVRTLDATDTLLHLCFHACLSGGDRLIWLIDIDRAVVRGSLDWGEVVARSRAWGAGLTTATMLVRARATLGTPVPDDALYALMPGHLARRVLNIVDHWFPPERSTGRGTPATLLAGSCRADVESTLQTTGRELVRRLSTITRTRSLDRPARLLGPPGPARRPGALRCNAATIERERAAYFDAVESGDDSSVRADSTRSASGAG